VHRHWCTNIRIYLVSRMKTLIKTHNFTDIGDMKSRNMNIVNTVITLLKLKTNQIRMEVIYFSRCEHSYQIMILYYNNAA